MARPDFIGDFTPTERAALDRSFGVCRLTLLARGRLHTDLVLLRWEPVAPTDRRASPLRPVLARGFYVLDGADGSVTPVPDGAFLAARYAGEFDPAVLATVKPAWWQQALDGIRNPQPWQIVVVILIWLVLLAIVIWRTVAGAPLV
jgi:hypothetical protein